MEWTLFCEQSSGKEYIVKLIFYLLYDSRWQVKMLWLMWPFEWSFIWMTFHSPISWTSILLSVSFSPEDWKWLLVPVTKLQNRDLQSLWICWNAFQGSEHVGQNLGGGRILFQEPRYTRALQICCCAGGVLVGSLWLQWSKTLLNDPMRIWKLFLIKKPSLLGFTELHGLAMEEGAMFSL